MTRGIALRQLLPAAVAAVGWPAPAWACTLCGSAAAVSVRARLLDGGLGWNALAVLLPIAVLLLIIAAVAYEPGPRGAE